MGENDPIPVDPDFAGDIRRWIGRHWRIKPLHVAGMIWVAVLLLTPNANAQAVRFDTDVTTVSAQCVAGKQCPVLSLPGTIVSVCGGSVSTLASCLAAPATTYTDFSAGTPCPTTAQLTPSTGGACLSTADAEGNAGFWALPGQYNYFLPVPATAGGGSYGPYPINVGASAGCPLGATCDASFSTLSAACTAAGTGTLYLTRTWSGLTAQTLACNIYALANGIIKPASGQLVTLSKSFQGTLSQHVDISSGGSVSFTGSVAVFYPQWFGPAGTCSGPSVDSVIAVQAAIDAAVGRTVELVGASTSCAISASGPGGSGGVTIYPNNAGITLSGNASIVGGVYSAGSGGGLVAYAANPPSAILTVFAGSVGISNLYLDCNSGAATNGIISAMGNSNRWTNVITRECSGDGGQVFNEGTPTTTLTAGTTAGSNTVLPVGATTTNRIVMGATYCTRLDVGYGTVNEELVTISSIASLNVTVASTAHNHSMGETVRCHGNSNDMHIERYSSYANDGWGFHVLPGNDNNSIYWADGYSSGNALGGELWSGVKHIHIGGNYQGDGGPAVQLGTTDGTHVTHLMAIEPLSDIEETDAAYDAVVSYCDDSSQVRFIPSSALNIVTSAVSPLTAPCSAHSSGSSTMGYGSNSSNGELYIKNASGQVRIVPSGANATITITNAAGTTVGSVIQTSNVSGSGLMLRKDIADKSHAQIEAAGSTNANAKLMLGFDTTNLLAFIQSTVYGSTANPLYLNPSGGELFLHTTTGVSALPACASANDGDTYFVIDSNTATFNAVVAAGGSNHIGVHCDGSASQWKVGR